jgi:hypothetical protein
MAATAGVATQITPYRVQITGPGTQPTRRLSEKASQTFQQGTPVQIDTGSGYLQACAAITSAATAVIAGISQEPASNLTTSGVAQTQNLVYKVPNQPDAVVTAIGAPPNDGTCGFYLSVFEQTFNGIMGNSATAADAVLAQTQLYAIFGLTQDATTLFWYVDNNITTTAGGACVQVVGFIDPIGTLNGRVEFRVTKAASQPYI